MKSPRSCESTITHSRPRLHLVQTSLVVLSVLTAFLGLRAQEPLPRADAVKFATLLNFDLDKLADTPIPTDGDVKRPYGLKGEQRAGLVVPEAKLSAATFAGLGKEVQPIGQMWLARLVPARDGQPVPADELKVVPAEHEGREVTLPLCVLGARKTAEGKLELLVYGKSKTPLLTVPITKATKPQKWPIEFDAEREGDTARVTLCLVGKYEASFLVTAPAD